MFNSLRRKMSLGFMGIAIISMLSMLVLMTWSTFQLLNEQSKTDGRIIANQISRSMDGLGSGTSSIQKYMEKSNEEEESITNVQYIDLNGKIVANSDKSQLNVDANSNVQSVLKSGKAIDYMDAKYMGFTTVVPHMKDGKIAGAVSITVGIQDLQSIVTIILKRIAFLFALILVVMLVIGLLASTKLVKPIKKMVSALETISEGDFTASFKVESKDELGRLATAMNRTLDVLREMIGSIKNTAVDLDNVSQTLSSSSEEVAASSVEVAQSIGQVADGVSKQSENLADSVNLLESFAYTFDSIKESVLKVSEESDKIKGAADIGSVKIEALVRSVDDVRQGFSYVIDKLSLLNNSVGKITEITEVINNVAGQTNLLALNAAIEAARAGEVGRGFSVVAEEIRKLAEQVSESSKGIMELVSTITQEAKGVTDTAGSVSGKMEEQMSTVKDTVSSFKDILMEVQLIAPQINNVNDSIQVAVSAKAEVVKRVESVAAVSEEISASTEEISASAEEQTAATEEFTATAQSLADMSKNLTVKIEKFKI